MPSTSSRNRPRNSACTSDRVSVSGRVVVVDANVLYSIELTDLLLTLATRRLVRLHWSPMILDEVRRNLAVRPDLSAEAIDYRLRRMNLAVPAALDEPPASLVQQMAVNEHDRHVLALAVDDRNRTEEALVEMAARRTRPPMSVAELLDRLALALPDFAAHMRNAPAE